MPEKTVPIKKPPSPFNAEGNARLVGIEIEFANINTVDASLLLQDLFGGSREQESEHRVTVKGTALGDFTVELDWAGAHPPTDAPRDDTSKNNIKQKAREIVGRAVSGLVPTEIVCPPIPWHRLNDLTPLFDSLRQAGAEGTEESIIYGFGLHLNPEVAEMTADYALRHLQAYVILEDWLRDQIHIDLMRRALPHIDPFPAAYAQRLMDAGYHPKIKNLIEDYVSDNPTRNRGLDMAPLFRYLDEATLMPAMKDAHLVKARPTFHYRLPNAQISDTTWNAVVEWNRWVEVERLAAAPDRLAEQTQAFAQWLAEPTNEVWLNRVKGWFS